MREEQASQLLTRILSTRGLDRPSGKPLFRYRCSDAEFNALAELLRGEGQLQDKGAAEAACFCLYAAEWWRRNADGGAWSWDPLLASLEWATPQSHALLHRLVESGLVDYWRRTILTRPLLQRMHGYRRFLVSLIVEGGLPMNLIRTEGSRLRRFFRALLEIARRFHLDAETAARSGEAVAHWLPESLRRDEIFELSGQLVAKIWELQDRVADDADPVAALHARFPGWLEELPLSVSEAVASELVVGLLRDARSIAQGRGAQLVGTTELRRSSGAWMLTRGLRAPSELPAEELAQLLAVPAGRLDSGSGRVLLQLEDARLVKRLVAVAFRNQAASEISYLIDPVQSARCRIEGAVAQHLVSLVASAEQHEVARVPLPGGEALGELPWVFVAPEEADGTEPAVLHLIGEGTVSTRQSAAYVAVLPSWTATGEGDADCVPLGVVSETGRTLHRVRGRIRFTGPDGACLVQSQASDEEVAHYSLHGERAPFAAAAEHPVFLGLPQVRRMQPLGPVSTIPAGELAWRPRGQPGSWRPVDASCLGDVSLRHVTGGEIRMQMTLCVLPSSARIALRPTGRGLGKEAGEIVLHGFRTESIHWKHDGGVHCTVELDAEADRCSLRVSVQREPPPRVAVLVLWPEGRQTELRVPLPAEGARFLRTDGRPLVSGKRVAAGRLAALRAEITALRPAHWNLIGRLRLEHPDPACDDLTYPQILRSAQVRASNAPHTIDLGEVTPQVLALLTTSSQPGAVVDLGLEQLGGRSDSAQWLKVSRFDGRIEPKSDDTEEPGHFALYDATNQALRGDSLDRVWLSARPLAAPARSFPLTREGDRFKLAREGLDTGAYMILGYEGDLCRFRPCLHYETGAGKDPLAASPETEPRQDQRGELPAIVDLREHAMRQVRLRALCSALATNSQHPDWPLVLSYLRLSREVPPYLFDIVNMLIAVPEALACAILLHGREEVHGLCDALELLPFALSAFPVRAWLAAAEVCLAPVRALSTEHLPRELRVAITQQVLSPLLEVLPTRLSGFSVIADLVRERVLGQPQPRPAMRAAKILEHYRQALIGRQADSDWPHYERLIAAYQRLVELEPVARLRGLIPDSALDERTTILVAPALAAFCSALGEQLSPIELFLLRQAQRFDSEWFDWAHALLLAEAVAALAVHAPQRLRSAPAKQ